MKEKIISLGKNSGLFFLGLVVSLLLLPVVFVLMLHFLCTSDGFCRKNPAH